MNHGPICTSGHVNSSVFKTVRGRQTKTKLGGCKQVQEAVTPLSTKERSDRHFYVVLAKTVEVSDDAAHTLGYTRVAARRRRLLTA
ncbi:hypothetical protein EVAR_75515_1 [Eumeta japonica]|uniref:Uncharacterized protein n=1 Tax=Eumeta variegata TaxID=151549 RepID=A0A4C1UIT0_EUMVA|nr:hypothetical protein EVAR_75515_1 [Eumeta japonica]